MPSQSVLPPQIERFRRMHAVDSESIDIGLAQVMKAHGVGILKTSSLEKAITRCVSCVSTHNVSKSKLTKILELAGIQEFEEAVGFVDLTWFGTGADFLLITNAGIHHKSMSERCFIPYYKMIAKDMRLERGREIVIGEIRLDVSGTDGDEVYSMLQQVKEIASEN